jgi:hypothetical protein
LSGCKPCWPRRPESSPAAANALGSLAVPRHAGSCIRTPGRHDKDVSVTHGKLGADAADFIAKPRRLLIDNEWVKAKSGKRFAVFDPAARACLQTADVSGA